MSNIGIIGYGIVGQATQYGFDIPENKIRYYDKYKDSDSLEMVVDSSEFIFVCLPTPFSESGERIDLTIIDENIHQINEHAKDTGKIIVIKSTVVPGTTSGYESKYPGCNFCFNPEFLTEANYLEDFVNANRIVIGANNNKTRLRVADLYRKRFPKTPMYLTDTTTAEMVKYMANAFLATKVLFANEIYGLCQRLGINYQEVKKMVVADARIYDSHLDVTTERGFGGKCFPKDLVALLGLCRELDVDVSLLEAVWKRNLKIRKHKDWEEIPGAVSK